MTYPTLDTTHNAEAQALLTDHYRNKVVIPGLLASYMASIQTLENVFWDIINKFLLVNKPVGDQLNSIGSIVGANRGSLSDADYLNAVIIQIRVNRSQGLCEDIIKIATLAMSAAGSPGLPQYLDAPPAAWILEVLNYPSPNVLAKLLSHARSVGTRGMLHYSTWTNGNNFKFTSRYKDVHEGAWGSRYTNTVGSLLVAGALI